MNHVVIIGGGFSGSLTAINLCRFSSGPLRITVVNSGYPAGRGVAYSTRNGHHLLNVAARNMSALADQPNHFVDWLHTRSEFADEPIAKLREQYMPRRVYGDYVRGLLYSVATLSADRGVKMETVAGEAVNIDLTAAGANVVLADGALVEADKVVLATGNPPPSALRIKGLDPAHPCFFQNPWSDWETQLTNRTQNIILIGTGLTAVDAIISLNDLGWQGRIFAVSRNGLLPLSHFKGAEYPDWIDGKADNITLAKAFAAFKRSYRKAKVDGVNPAILVDKLRPHTHRIWQHFSLAEKRRFNRHLRTRWNVVRHRIAQSIHQLLADHMEEGRLEIVKGRLCGGASRGENIALTVKCGDELRELEGCAVINCTGPSESLTRSLSPFYAKLVSLKVIEPDAMDMGLQVNSDYAVVTAGKASSRIFAIGPLLKGTLWESSAVPELRSQAFRLAEILLKQFGEMSGARVEEARQAVLEYEI